MDQASSDGVVVDRRAEINTPSISAVILNWNDSQSTIACITSVLQSEYRNVDVVILDNGSTDDSLKNLLHWHDSLPSSPSRSKIVIDASCTLVSRSERVYILSNEENEGYTGGMNKAISFAITQNSPEYIFLLNNDAIVERNCLVHCVATSRRYHAAIVGALVKSSDGNAVLFSGSRPWRELFVSTLPVKEESLPDDWETGRVEGSGILLRTDFLKEVVERFGNVFEPTFFLYGDDIELGLRAHFLKARIYMTKSAVIYHGLAKSMGGAGNPMHSYYITRNRVSLAKRWLPLPLKLIFHLYFPPTRLLRAAHRLVQGKNDVARAIVEGLFDGYKGRSGKWTRHTL